jgi:hypothetical protein
LIPLLFTAVVDLDVVLVVVLVGWDDIGFGSHSVATTYTVMFLKIRIFITFPNDRILYRTVHTLSLSLFFSSNFESNMTRCQVSLYATDLPRVGYCHQAMPNPYAIIHMNDGGNTNNGAGTMIGCTEIVLSSRYPDWVQIMYLDVPPGSSVQLSISIYDDPSSRSWTFSKVMSMMMRMMMSDTDDEIRAGGGSSSSSSGNSKHYMLHHATSLSNIQQPSSTSSRKKNDRWNLIGEVLIRTTAIQNQQAAHFIDAQLSGRGGR